jgi:antitoxin component of MazEF toxin-antitoxin module
MTNTLVVRVRKYGKSLIVYLPKKDAESAGFHEGDYVNVNKSFPSGKEVIKHENDE